MVGVKKGSCRKVLEKKKYFFRYLSERQNLALHEGRIWTLQSNIQYVTWEVISSSPNCVFFLDGWFHLLRSRGLWNNGSHRHCYNCSSYISTYISMYAWSCSFTGGYLQELFRLLTDRDYMLTNVFVKLTLSCNHNKNQAWQNIETFHAWSNGEELWLETEY